MCLYVTQVHNLGIISTYQSQTKNHSNLKEINKIETMGYCHAPQESSPIFHTETTQYSLEYYRRDTGIYVPILLPMRPVPIS